MNWLKSFVGDDSVSYAQNQLTGKFLLMKKLRSQVLLKTPNSVTQVFPQDLSLQKRKFNFTYQRQEITFEQETSLELFYPNLRSDLKVFGAFTANGQGATYSLFCALKNHLSDIAIAAPRHLIYFETQQVFRDLKIPVTEDSENLFLDSSGLVHHPLHYLQGQKIKRLIIDSTAWGLQSQELQSVIDLAQKNRWELYLMRSHLKLDSFGAEYALLGSVLRIAPEQDELFNRHLKSTLSTVGLVASTENIYPFLWDEEFHRLNDLRIERIRANSRYLGEALPSFLSTLRSKMVLMTFQHEIYFNVSFKGKDNLFGEKFLKLAHLHQVPAKFCNSFGFDFPSLSNFIVIQALSEDQVMRFCPGDNPELMPDVLRFIQDYLAYVDQQISY